MEYTEAYVDWRYSVEIAMQGTIARIRHKYRALIPRPLAYGMIGERSVGGHAVDRRGQEFHSLLRGYLTERERCSVNLEDMQKLGDEKKQIEEVNNELKFENEKLKMKIAELEASQKKEESEEEEDPEERLMYSSSDGLSYEEWEAKALRDLKNAERRGPLPLLCLKRVKRG
jgi:hypothetical protein